MIYTHVLGRGGHAVLSPADSLLRPGLTGRGEFRQLEMHPNLRPPASGNLQRDQEDAVDSDESEEED